MHALTTKVLDSGIFAYALIPTYYKSNVYLRAKVYIEYVHHFDNYIFYHVSISELLDDSVVAMKKLSTASFRCIHRKTHKLCITNIPVVLSLSKAQLMSQIQVWHGNYVIDLPAPFIAEDEQSFTELCNEVAEYYQKLELV